MLQNELKSFNKVYSSLFCDKKLQDVYTNTFSTFFIMAVSNIIVEYYILVHLICFASPVQQTFGYHSDNIQVIQSAESFN